MIAKFRQRVAERGRREFAANFVGLFAVIFGLGAIYGRKFLLGGDPLLHPLIILTSAVVGYAAVYSVAMKVQHYVGRNRAEH
jgi:hypothetical protein